MGERVTFSQLSSYYRYLIYYWDWPLSGPFSSANYLYFSWTTCHWQTLSVNLFHLSGLKNHQGTHLTLYILRTTPLGYLFRIDYTRPDMHTWQGCISCGNSKQCIFDAGRLKTIVLLRKPWIGAFLSGKHNICLSRIIFFRKLANAGSCATLIHAKLIHS